jgi:hypothetical protein
VNSDLIDMDVSLTDWNFGLNPPGCCRPAGHSRMNQKSNGSNIYKLKIIAAGMA